MTENKIEYEEITIKVPKKVMDLLRFAEKGDRGTPKEYLECAVLQEVRANLEAGNLLENDSLAIAFELKPIYHELLGSY